MKELQEILKKINDSVDYEKETALLSDGILNSVELVELIAGIEETYGVEIPLDEITPENFDSVSDISGMIMKLKEQNM